MLGYLYADIIFLLEANSFPIAKLERLDQSCTTIYNTILIREYKPEPLVYNW